MVGEPGLVFDGDGQRRVEAILGAALEAAVEGYTLLVDEGDSIAPGVHAQCHGLFDKRVRRFSFWLNGRKDFVKHPDFRFIFTGNTKGEDENHLEFAHSQAQSKALMNRMAYVVDVDYMTPDAEVSLLGKRIPNVDKWIVERMVKCANNVRKLYKQGSISIVVSTRDIEAWGRNIERAIRTGASAQDNQEFWTKVAVPAAGPTVLNKTSDTASASAAAREFSWR
jgi:MoxR-like ATPase